MIRSGRACALALAAAGALSAGGCASVRGLWQEASNRDMTNRVAPALQSTAWIHCDANAPAPALAGRWTLLAFFDPQSSATAERLAELSRIQDEFQPDGVVVFGITEVDRERTAYFLEEEPVRFSVLAGARADRVAFGIKNLWEPVVYLVDPYERILAKGLAASRGLLQEKFGH
ncbi:MAG: hypothetical protein AB1726_14455 [Planctomycetota bacterium]